MNALDLPLGKIPRLSDEEYHASNFVSASKLKTFARKPGGAQLYYQKYIAKTVPQPESDALLFGRALHCLVLEGREAFDARFIAVPDNAPDRPTAAMLKAANPSPNSIARAKWWDNFNEISTGKVMIDADTLRSVNSLAHEIKRQPEIAQLLSAGEPELTWRMATAGTIKHLPGLQCRTDWFNPDGCELSQGRPYVFDLKSTATLDETAFGNFERGAEDHRYDIQAALYMQILEQFGITCRDFFFGAVEKCAPYAIEVYRLEDREIARGQEDAITLLEDLSKCYQRNIWPNAMPGVKPLKFSSRFWARGNAYLEE